MFVYFKKPGPTCWTLINNILDLSKVESGHVELESIGFDLGALLQKIIEMMAAQARERGLQLTLEILPGVPLGLVGDPNRLRQILVNLVGNALKFTERGSVTLRVEPDPDLSGAGGQAAARPAGKKRRLAAIQRRGYRDRDLRGQSRK